jgi:glycosyltransferase involved in cell wall biosynthesis
MNPEISIIVPVYKVENYIEKCIESVLAQTFTNFELILVNDGSPDNCGNICDEYARLDKRIKVIHKENGGLSSARNAGLSKAKGKYIAFVDSDDFIHQSMYEILHGYGTKYASDIVICDYLDVYEGEIYDTEEYNPNFNEENYTNIEALYQLYSKKGVQFVIACNKLYKRDLFNDLEYKEGVIHEDEFMAHRILFNSSKVTYLPIKLYYYLQRKDGIVRSQFNIKKLDAVNAYKDRVEFFRKIKQHELQIKAEYSYISLLFLYYFKVKGEIPNSYKELRVLKNDFRNSLRIFINNPYFSLKEKICWLLFVFHPSLFGLFYSK